MLFIQRASPPAAGPLLVAFMLAGLPAKRLGAVILCQRGRIWVISGARGSHVCCIGRDFHHIQPRGHEIMLCRDQVLPDGISIWHICSICSRFCMCLGGTEAERICPIEGNRAYPGPSYQLTSSPEPSSETPRPEEDMNSRTLDYMILH